MGDDDKQGSLSVEKLLPLPHPKKLKILTTAAIYFGNITLGYGINGIAPAIEDIRLRYDTGIDQISVVFTVELVLYCIGALTYGFVSKCINRQIVVMVALTGMAFSMYMIPNCPTKLVFFIVGGVLGFSAGNYDASQVVWIIEIWQEKAGPFILAQHFCFAIGSIIPSILIAPFLTTDNGSESSRIYIPYAILGAITTLALLFQVLLFTFCRYYMPPIYASEMNSIDIVSSQGGEGGGEQETSEVTIVTAKDGVSSILGINKRKLQLMIVTGMFLGAYQGMEVCTMQFLPIFGQYSNLQMTESASAYVLTGLTGMFAIGRAIGVVIILKVRPEGILCVNIGLVVIANLIVLIWADDNLTMFWIGCIILGAGFSTIYPAFCAFMEKYLVFTNAVGSLVCVVGSVFAAIYPLIVGKLIEKKAVVLTYINFFSTAACILVITWGYLLVRKVKTRV